MLTSVRPSVKDGVTRVDHGRARRGAPRTSTSSWRSSRRRARSRTYPCHSRIARTRGCTAPCSRASTAGTGQRAAGRRPDRRRRRRPRRGGAPPPRAKRAGRSPVTPRRVLHEKRALIWPIAIALFLNVALFAVRRLSAVAEGRRRGAGGRGLGRRADRRAARPRGHGHRAGQGAGGRRAAEVLRRGPAARLSGARRITFLRIEQLAAAVQPAAGARSVGPEAAARQRLVKFTYTAVALGRVPQYPAVHPRARNGAGVPGARERRADAERSDEPGR